MSNFRCLTPKLSCRFTLRCTCVKRSPTSVLTAPKASPIVLISLNIWGSIWASNHLDLVSIVAERWVYQSKKQKKKLFFFPSLRGGLINRKNPQSVWRGCFCQRFFTVKVIKIGVKVCNSQLPPRRWNLFLPSPPTNLCPSITASTPYRSEKNKFDHISSGYGNSLFLTTDKGGAWWSDWLNRHWVKVINHTYFHWQLWSIWLNGGTNFLNSFPSSLHNWVTSNNIYELIRVRSLTSAAIPAVRRRSVSCPISRVTLGVIRPTSPSSATGDLYKLRVSLEITGLTNVSFSCYKCFTDENSLLEHIPKHKESKHLKIHICPYCGKSYTQVRSPHSLNCNCLLP